MAIDEIGIGHRIREASGEPEGALILNHGRGADENDLFGLLDELDPKRRLLGITTGAPFVGIPPGGRHWYSVERVGYPNPAMFATSYSLLTGLADDLLAARGIDWSTTVIGGFSMGTAMSYAVALGEDRPLPGGLLALSGFIPVVDGFKPALEGREGLPVLIHHGRNDPVIEVGFAERAASALSGAGLRPRLLLSDAGHALPPEIIAELRDFVAAATVGKVPTAGGNDG